MIGGSATVLLLLVVVFLAPIAVCLKGGTFYIGDDWCSLSLSLPAGTPCESLVSPSGDLVLVAAGRRLLCPLSRGPWLTCRPVLRDARANATAGAARIDSAGGAAVTEGTGGGAGGDAGELGRKRDRGGAGRGEGSGGSLEDRGQQPEDGWVPSARPAVPVGVARMLAWAVMNATPSLSRAAFFEVLGASDARVGTWEGGSGLVTRYRLGFVTMGNPLMMRAAELLVPLHIANETAARAARVTITAFSEEIVGADEIHDLKASCAPSEAPLLAALKGAHLRPLGCTNGRLYFLRNLSCHALVVATNATERCPFSDLLFTVDLKESPELIGVGAILWIAAAVAGTGLFAVSVAIFDSWSTSRKKLEGRAKEERLRVLDRFLDTGEIDPEEIEKED